MELNRVICRQCCKKEKKYFNDYFWINRKVFDVYNYCNRKNTVIGINEVPNSCPYVAEHAVLGRKHYNGFIDCIFYLYKKYRFILTDCIFGFIAILIIIPLIIMSDNATPNEKFLSEWKKNLNEGSILMLKRKIEKLSIKDFKIAVLERVVKDNIDQNK